MICKVSVLAVLGQLILKFRHLIEHHPLTVHNQTPYKSDSQNVLYEAANKKSHEWLN